MKPATPPPPCCSQVGVPGAESGRHRRLKELAVAWARAQGFALATTEVRVPRSGYRADVAAYAVRRQSHAADGPTEPGRTAIFECKQARADLLKDAHDTTAVRAELDALIARRSKLEALLAVHRPDLRRGESLFPEYDAWDFAGMAHQTYDAILARMGTLQARLLKGTKFAKMRRYRCADFLYLVVEDDIYAEAEIPAGWGLLVQRDDGLHLQRRPLALDAEAVQRQALLEAIALAATSRERPRS